MVQKAVVALLSLVAVLAAGPPGAAAATGTARFTVPPAAAAQPSHTEFWLPPGYEQLIGAMGGNPAIGNFRRTVTSTSRRNCVDSLEAFGRAQHAPPTVRGDRVQLVKGHEPGYGARSKYLRVIRSGHTGKLRWYVGPTWSWPRTAPNPRYTNLTALAVLRAPSRFVPARTPWAVVTLGLNSTCKKGQSALISELSRAIRATRIVAGRATAAPGVPVATA